MYIKPLPPQEYLKECFEHREDGVLIGKVRPRSHFSTDGGFAISASRSAGNPVGYVNDKGYLEVMLRYNGKRIKLAAHRVIWTMHYGLIPEGYLIDHKDTVRLNNKIENLRLTLPTGNSQNSSLSATNTIGAKCVVLDKRRNLYYVHIMVNGKRHIFGGFFSLQMAEFTARVNRLKLHKEFTNHGD
jgi:hypothetical protein